MARLTREEFDRRYWKSEGPDKVPASTRREFYSDYKESGLSFAEYVRQTTTQANPHHRNPAKKDWYIDGAVRGKSIGPFSSLAKAKAYVKEHDLSRGSYRHSRYGDGTTIWDEYDSENCTITQRPLSPVSAPVGSRYNPRRRVRKNGPTLDRPSYPFTEMEERYAGYTDDQLAYALKDAREAARHEDAMAKAGHGLARYGWYADDVHTIGAEIMRRRKSKIRRANPAARCNTRDTASYEVVAWAQPRNAQRGDRIVSVERRKDGTAYVTFGFASADDSGRFEWRPARAKMDKVYKTDAGAARAVNLWLKEGK
jgi:hypothetical protein